MTKLRILILLFSVFIRSLAFSQKVQIQSPDQEINAVVFCQQNTEVGEWYIKASYNNNGKITEAIAASLVPLP